MSFRDGDYRLEESQRLEFKEAVGGLPNDLWETYSAFANTEGGEIVLGVSEDRVTHAYSLDGVSNASDIVDLVWTSVRNQKIVGRDILLSDSVGVVSRNGLDFVVVNVPRAEREERPVEVYDRPSKSFIAYIRRGTVDQKATKDDLSRMDYDKAAEADGVGQADLIWDVVVAQNEDVFPVQTFGRRSQPEEEPGLEMFHNFPVAVRGRVVELVEHDVIEPIRWESGQVAIHRQRLNAGEKKVRLRLIAASVQETSRLSDMYLLECLLGLFENLAPVSNEEDRSVSLGILGGDEGLADAGAGHNQCFIHAFCPGSAKCSQGADLRAARRWHFWLEHITQYRRLLP